MLLCLSPTLREFRDDVVRVARDRDPGVTVEQIAKDFGVHPMTLFKWLRQAEVDEGAKPGVSRGESADTTAGRSRALWYPAYGVLPSLTPTSPARANDQWSLDRLVQRRVPVPDRAAAASSSACSARPPAFALQTGTMRPTPTRSIETIPRSAARCAAGSDATYAREP